MTSDNLKVQKLLYGQLVIGPPGSGKSTYCHKITEFYKQLNRKVSVVNLDPANENMQYQADIDIMSLITVEDVMENLNLGPNGALMYCIEFLETNFDWLLQKIKESTSNYFLFDCPGKEIASGALLTVQINHLFCRSSRTLYTSSINAQHIRKARAARLPSLHSSPRRFSLLQ